MHHVGIFSNGHNELDPGGFRGWRGIPSRPTEMKTIGLGLTGQRLAGCRTEDGRRRCRGRKAAELLIMDRMCSLQDRHSGPQGSKVTEDHQIDLARGL